MALTEPDARPRANATRAITSLPPRRRSRHELPNVAKEFNAVGFRSPSADHIHTVLETVVLSRGQVECTRFVRPSSQLSPLELVGSLPHGEIERPEVVHCRFESSATLSTRQVNHVPDQRRLTVSARSWQRWQVDRPDCLSVRVPLQG